MEGISPYAWGMIAIFVIGYVLITLEHLTKINKATVALMMAILCWVLQFADHQWAKEENTAVLTEHIASISQVIFFLVGALTVVEIINVHKGFSLISDWIRVRSKRMLLWTIGGIAFFLSAILDNLTTTIVMLSLLQKLIPAGDERKLLGGAIVIAANAGGAWTPIGDVTTTMLWIGGQISTINVMKELLMPSLVCVVASLLMFTPFLKGNFSELAEEDHDAHSEPFGRLIFWLGIGLLIFVPVFKILTGLPPFMGMLFALSVLWLVTDFAHRHYDDRDHLRVPHILTKIDLSGPLFFLGILLCINALDSANLLKKLAVWLDASVGNTTIIAVLIGLASAVIDNVPLVAASMGMYSLEHYPMDSPFWQLVAFCAGTGGSILIIGSAAGVVYMSIEKVDFFWYLRRISLAAAVGYFAGILAYIYVI